MISLAKLSDDAKVSTVAAICILGSAVIYKNVLHVDVPLFVLFGPAWIYIAYLTTRGRDSTNDKPVYWNLVLILTTIATILLYAF